MFPKAYRPKSIHGHPSWLIKIVIILYSYRLVKLQRMALREFRIMTLENAGCPDVGNTVSPSLILPVLKSANTVESNSHEAPPSGQLLRKTEEEHSGLRLR